MARRKDWAQCQGRSSGGHSCSNIWQLGIVTHQYFSVKGLMGFYAEGVWRHWHYTVSPCSLSLSDSYFCCHTFSLSPCSSVQTVGLLGQRETPNRYGRVSGTLHYPRFIIEVHLCPVLFSAPYSCFTSSHIAWGPHLAWHDLAGSRNMSGAIVCLFYFPQKVCGCLHELHCDVCFFTSTVPHYIVQ